MNTVRRAAGAGLLNQSAQLDVAASAHANYLGANIGASGHGEDAAKFGFYEVSPASRVQKAGFAASFATEAISANNPLFNLFAFDCVRELLNSVYNAVALLGPATHVGFGLDSTHATTPLCISVLAAQASVPHGQVAAAGALLAYPYDGQADVIEDVDLNIESPRPSPAALPNAAAGTPVIVSVRNADYLNLQAAGSLNARVTKFELLDAGGNPVPAALLAHAALAGGPGVVLTEDANLPAGTVVLVPLSPLVRGQSYAVSFAATLQDGGAALQRSWSFTTRP